MAQGQSLNYGETPHTKGVTAADGSGLAPWQVLVNFLDNHDLPRFLYDYHDKDGLKVALALLLTMDGIPCLYYGTEQDFSGGNDPANREDMWHTGFATDGDTFKWVKQLIDLRKKQAPLRRGNMKVVWSSENSGTEKDAGILAFERTIETAVGPETVLVVLNLSKSNATWTSAKEWGGEHMKTSFAKGTKLVNMLDEPDPTDDVTVGDNGEINIKLQPRTAKVFVVR
jgi:glycosidase